MGDGRRCAAGAGEAAGGGGGAGVAQTTLVRNSYRIWASEPRWMRLERCSTGDATSRNGGGEGGMQGKVSGRRARSGPSRSPVKLNSRLSNNLAVCYERVGRQREHYALHRIKGAASTRGGGKDINDEARGGEGGEGG